MEVNEIIEEETTEEVELDENTMIEEIIEDLAKELNKTDDEFDLDLLIPKVRNAYREVKAERKYPAFYTHNMIVKDMQGYYTMVRKIALYDYNQIDVEFQTSHSESSISRQWIDRDNLFSGLYPLSK